MSFRATQVASASGGGALPTVTGSKASPQAITAAGGVSVAGAINELQYVIGSPGAVIVAASPQIAAGPNTGAQLTLIGTDDTKTVTLTNGHGLVLNGTCVLKNGSSLLLSYDGTNWNEVSRNDI